MSGREEPSGPQFRADRPAEQPAVRTTIVGGRPPGSGQPIGDIPRGMEVLLKKAAVDPAFKDLLLRDRTAAAASIGLALEPAEAMMLAATPAGQLEAIIARTTVPQQHRRVFLGQAAAAMLAALAVVTQGCDRPPPPAGGSRPPDRPPTPTKGIQPDQPPVSDDGPPPRPPVCGGSRPDNPIPPPEQPKPAVPPGLQPEKPAQPPPAGKSEKEVLPEKKAPGPPVVGGSRPDRPRW